MKAATLLWVLLGLLFAGLIGLVVYLFATRTTTTTETRKSDDGNLADLAAGVVGDALHSLGEALGLE